MSNASTARLDAFTDAAFAFAVTLLVVGAGGQVDGTALRQMVAALPAFAIGFAIIAMFWLAHVRWRRFRGDGDWRSLLLTLTLVFAVLVYVMPLRAMAGSLSQYLGAGGGFEGHFGELFATYGLGFAVMSALTAALFRDAGRHTDGADRAASRGEMWIWVMLAATGLGSVMLALSQATMFWAPWLYATLPLTVGAFAARWRWDGGAHGGGEGQGAGTA